MLRIAIEKSSSVTKLSRLDLPHAERRNPGCLLPKRALSGVNSQRMSASHSYIIRTRRNGSQLKVAVGRGGWREMISGAAFAGRSQADSQYEAHRGSGAGGPPCSVTWPAIVASALSLVPPAHRQRCGRATAFQSQVFDELKYLPE